MICVCPGIGQNREPEARVGDDAREDDRGEETVPRADEPAPPCCRGSRRPIACASWTIARARRLVGWRRAGSPLRQIVGAAECVNRALQAEDLLVRVCDVRVHRAHARSKSACCTTSGSGASFVIACSARWTNVEDDDVGGARRPTRHPSPPAPSSLECGLQWSPSEARRIPHASRVVLRIERRGDAGQLLVARDELAVDARVRVAGARQPP